MWSKLFIYTICVHYIRFCIKISYIFLRINLVCNSKSNYASNLIISHTLKGLKLIEWRMLCDIALVIGQTLTGGYRRHLANAFNTRGAIICSLIQLITEVHGHVTKRTNVLVWKKQNLGYMYNYIIVPYINFYKSTILFELRHIIA